MNEIYVTALAVGLSIATSILFHYFRRRWFDTSVLAGLTFSFLWQILAYIDLGYIDPFAPIAFVMGSLAGTGVAMIVGLPFLFYRRQQKNIPPTQ